MNRHDTGICGQSSWERCRTPTCWVAQFIHLSRVRDVLEALDAPDPTRRREDVRRLRRPDVELTDGSRASIFVAALGASSYTYACATPRETMTTRTGLGERLHGHRCCGLARRLSAGIGLVAGARNSAAP